MIPDWLSLSTTAGTSSVTVTVTASSYSEILERSASLKISTANKSAYVSISQKKNNSFFIGPSSLSFSALGQESKTISITSDCSWSATSYPAWITLSTVSGSGNTAVTVTCSGSDETLKSGNIEFINDNGFIRMVSVSSIADLSVYVVCTYETTEPNQVIRLFGMDECGSYYTRYGIWHPSTKTVTYKAYMEDIVLADGVQYHQIDPDVDELDDAFFFPSAGTHTVLLRFPNDEIGYNGYSKITYSGIGDKITLHFYRQFPFKDNPYIRTIYIPSGVTFVSGEGKLELYNGLAAGCAGLLSITSDTYGAMRWGFAQNCPNLTGVTIQEDYISDYAFANCDSLVLPLTGWTSIGSYAFANCDGYTGEVTVSGVTLGENTFVNLGEGIFSGCTGITKINAIECVSTNYPFKGYTGEVYDDNTSGKPLPIAGSDITKLVWGSHITGNYWYDYFNPSLREWEWQNSGATWLNCSVNGAFQSASSLNKITMAALTPPTIQYGGFFGGRDDFKGIAQFGTLTYPEGADYSTWLKTDPYWLGYYYWNYSGTTGWVATTAMTMDNTGSTAANSVTSSKPWYAVTNDSWITVNPSSGSNGNTEITITAEENLIAYRTGYVYIYFSGGTLLGTIEVQQDAYIPPTPPSYLAFTMAESGHIVFKTLAAYPDPPNRTILYSKDNGTTWGSLTSSSGGTSLSVLGGEVVLFSGNNTTYRYANLTSTAQHTVSGSLNALIKGGNITNQYCFSRLFEGSTGLVSASGLTLPSNTTNNCYEYMFNGCTGLTSAPVLPATGLSKYCYLGMFGSCTSLTTAPVLSATTLVSSCYQSMFAGCENLQYIKCLATDISASYCLNSWVNGVSASGTFVKATGITYPEGSSGIPNGWTVVEE